MSNLCEVFLNLLLINYFLLPLFESLGKQWLALLQGTVVVTDDAGNTIFSHSVEAGDIWRMCQTKDAAIKVTST